MSFVAFPKTPHLSGSVGSGDDDAIVGLEQMIALFEHEADVAVVLEEKVDGANVSVHFESEASRWTPTLQKRSGVLQTNELTQYNLFRDWVFERIEALWAALTDRFVLFGECLIMRHAVAYNRLPDMVLAFDVFDKQSAKFLSRRRVERLLAATDVRLVPLIDRFEAHMSTTSANSSSSSSSSSSSRRPLLSRELLTELAERQSALGDERREGVYLRVERNGFVEHRFKFRRDTFVPGAAGFRRDHTERNEIVAVRSDDDDNNDNNNDELSD
jgi:atypical dual specificity phosphatase